jgi:hypothetical protein
MKIARESRTGIQESATVASRSARPVGRGLKFPGDRAKILWPGIGSGRPGPAVGRGLYPVSPERYHGPVPAWPLNLLSSRLAISASRRESDLIARPWRVTAMSIEPKPTAPPHTTPAQIKHREKGIRIFTWPKVIYIFPSAIVALICAIGMWSLRDKQYDPTLPHQAGASAPNTMITADATGKAEPAHASTMSRKERFTTPQNLLGVLFLAVLAFNLLVMALDFPRFELVGVILLILFALFFILWLGAFFQLDLMTPINALFAWIYVFANAGFYLVYFLIVSLLLLIVYITRWLDFWEVMPNEILHHHGPLSDLERFPTMNLKFDKEIPDVLEFALLGAGRLVMHVPNVEKALVLDNVLFINSKEAALKSLMSRLEVRVTTDQEVGEGNV